MKNELTEGGELNESLLSLFRFDRRLDYKNGGRLMLVDDTYTYGICQNAVIDTEETQVVSDIIVNGYEELYVEKDGHIQVAWVDTDREVFICLPGTALGKEIAIEIAKTIEIHGS